MSSRFYLVESNGALTKKGDLLLIEMFPQNRNGKLKKFCLDGEGGLGIPAFNGPKSKTKPFVIGTLIWTGAQLPTPEQTPGWIETLCGDVQGRQVVMIPANHGDKQFP